MGKGLFFTGTILKNNRDILKEEAVRQQLALSQERLDLQNEEFSRRRQEARRKADMDLYNSLDITGAGNYRDYFIRRQKEILDFSAKNADTIYSDPTSDAAVQLINMQNNFKGDIELAKQRGNLFNVHQTNKIKGDVGAYKINDDGSLQFESRENDFMKLIMEGKSFSDANNLFDLTASSVINKTQVNPFENTLNLKFAGLDKSEEVIGNTIYTGYDRNTKKQIRDEFALQLSPDLNGNFSDSYYKDYYFNGEIIYATGEIDEKGNPITIKGRAMDAFFSEKGIAKPETTKENKLYPLLDDGTKNPEFDPNLASEYVEFITNKQMELLPSTTKTTKDKPEADKTNYFNVIPDEIKDEIEQNKGPFKEKDVINGVPYNTKLYETPKKTITIKVGINQMLDEGDNVSDFTELLKLRKLSSEDIKMINKNKESIENISKTLEVELKKLKKEGEKIAAVKRYNKNVGVLQRINDNIIGKADLNQATLDSNLVAVTRTKSGKMVGVVEVGKKSFLVPLDNIQTAIDAYKIGGSKDIQTKGYYMFRYDGIASGEVDTSAGEMTVNKILGY